MRELPRIPSLPGVVKCLLARAKVHAALRQGVLRVNVPPAADALPAELLPSSARLGTADRVLGELDQDGFAVAVAPEDVPFFNRRRCKLARFRYRLHVVLRAGAVWLRKQFTPKRLRVDPLEWLWNQLGLRFYASAAAHLELRGLPCVPTIREIDCRSRTIYMDYIWGQNLRHHLSRDGSRVHDLDIRGDAVLSRLSDEERNRREINLYADELARDFGPRVKEVILAINWRGVAVPDVKPGNVLLGGRTGAL
jgi:hypothetical protein